MDEYIGLSQAEAKKSQKNFGTNYLPEKEKVTFKEKFFENLNNPIITILLVALGINLFFTFMGKVEWFECVGIFASVLISTLVSTFSEYKNENTFKNLQKRAMQSFCKVYRDNLLIELPFGEIVKNDIILLQAGDLVPADGIILFGKISVNQSSLNGENDDVEKKPSNINSNTDDLWSENRVFRGSVVSSGQATIRVESVGENTVYGKLSKDAQTEEEESPLSQKLARLAKDISKFGYIGASLIFIIFMTQKICVQNNFSPFLIKNYFMDFSRFFSDFIEALIMCITVLVVAVPDGLPLMIAIVCSLNMRKMLKDNVLVRKIIGIETSGGLNILFTDKTGTLTDGKLSVNYFIDGNNNIYETNSKIPKKLKNLIFISIINNSGSFISKNKVIGGNATERALLLHIMNEKLPNPRITKNNEIPFSSEKKYSECEIRGEINYKLIKGAPDIVLPNCKTFFDSNGEIKPFLKGKTEKFIENEAQKSQRIIAFAIADLNKKDEWIFLCCASLKDNIRKNVKKAVRDVSAAGIKVVMITGDKSETALSVAKECGIITDKNYRILTSNELRGIDNEDLKKILPDLCVVSRAVPSDKNRLVSVAKEFGLVVGMTGDGVNDAPALKNADVGFAMGSGTDTAKEAGDIIILDNNFESVRKAVLYGRTIYKSIKKFITFQLTINIAAVSVSVLSFFFGIVKPLSITQMLWINLLMDTLAAIAFGGEAPLKKYMIEKPIRKNDKILDKKMWRTILINSCFITLMSIFYFTAPYVKSIINEREFYTGFFSLFVFTSIFNAFNTRADGIDLTENLLLNKRFVWIMSIISLIQIIMTYFGGNFLKTSCLSLQGWTLILLLSFLIIPLDFIRKLTER